MGDTYCQKVERRYRDTEMRDYTKGVMEEREKELERWRERCI